MYLSSHIHSLRLGLLDAKKVSHDSGIHVASDMSEHAKTAVHWLLGQI